MPNFRNVFAGTALLCCALFVHPHSARAAQSYDNCAGTISSLPATISTQGVWCLKGDLATNLSSGEAITVAANNVTIDCNDFKLGGLAAGSGTQTTGIYAGGRLNTTVRHCNIRGFLFGVYLNNNGGSVVEDSRFDNNTLTGIYVAGDNSVIRRNLVYDTGDSSLPGLTNDPAGIDSYYSVDILDNTVSGVTAPAGNNNNAYGIRPEYSTGAAIVDNQVRGLLPDGAGMALGILPSPGDNLLTLVGNRIIGGGSAKTIGVGMSCTGSSTSRAKDNIIAGFASGIVNCGDAGGNDYTP